jgi:hypothetical protein
MCRCNGKSYINEGHWMEPQAYLKRDLDNRNMDGSVVTMLNIWKDLISCM